MFNTYLKAWSLKADGAPIIRHSNRLLPVRLASGKPAMLKIALEAQEQRGGQVMRCCVTRSWQLPPARSVLCNNSVLSPKPVD